MSLALIKESGYESDKAKNRIAYGVDQKIKKGVKLGDLTNAEMYVWDKAKSKFHGQRKQIAKGKEAAGYANWAKTNRSEPGKNTVGLGGDIGDGKSFRDHKKDPTPNPVKKPSPKSNPTAQSTTPKATPPKVNGKNIPKTNTGKGMGKGKAGLILGGAGLGLIGLTEYMDHKNDK